MKKLNAYIGILWDDNEERDNLYEQYCLICDMKTINDLNQDDIGATDYHLQLAHGLEIEQDHYISRQRLMR